MAVKRLLQLNVLLIVVAVTVAFTWIASVDGFSGLAGLARVNWLYIMPMLALTGICVLVRFIRWQFLMRHAGTRLNERHSLVIYLASLVGTATPAYIGEAIRAAFLRHKFGVPARISLFILVVERLFDVVALALLAGMTAHTWWMRGVMAAIGLAAISGMAIAMTAARAAGVPESAILAVRRRDILIDSLMLSLVAWGLVAFQFNLAASSIHLDLSSFESVSVFTSSALFGALTLMPAGIGATGVVATVELQNVGVMFGDAVVIVVLVRLATTAATLLTGTLCLITLWRPSKSAAADAAEHFDDIAMEYGEQFRPHVWNHLLDRKVNFMTGELPEPGAAGHGLDLGCGLGRQCLAMEKRGYKVYGMEIAYKLAVRAREAGASVVAGSALTLPFKDASLDFVYAVGVLHHLPDRQAQRSACLEVARVLKPGGVFLVHETNTRNPLFRFYMGYVFPLLKKIDEGTEWWIEPGRWKTLTDLEVVRVHHFTFMPDFVPAWMMKPIVAIDRWLERTPLRPYSIHYMAVLRRNAGATQHAPADAATRELPLATRTVSAVTSVLGQ